MAIAVSFTAAVLLLAFIGPVSQWLAGARYSLGLALTVVALASGLVRVAHGFSSAATTALMPNESLNRMSVLGIASVAVAIVGEDQVRYYGAHLSQVAQGITPGVRVWAGQLLGLTGQTGNARTTAPHLHFGISHPTTPDDWQVRRGEISPYTYLRAWAAGTPTAPRLTH